MTEQTHGAETQTAHPAAAADGPAGAGAPDTPPAAAAAVTSSAAAPHRPIPHPPPAPAPFTMLGAAAAREDGRYTLEELLALHDRTFAEAAFAAALGRAPEPAELESTLAELRWGRRTKREIVEMLAGSEEGLRAGAGSRLGVAPSPAWKRRLRALPVVGYLWLLLGALARLPVALRHQRQFEAYALGQQQRLADSVNAQQRYAEEELRPGLIDAAEAVSMLSDALAEFGGRLAEWERQAAGGRAEMTAALAELQRHVAGRERQLEEQRRKDRERFERLEDNQRAEAQEREALAASHRAGAEERGALAAALRAEAGARAAAVSAETRAREAFAAAQQELLIHEQAAIVEAQKAALALTEARLREASEEQRRSLDELAAEVRALGAAFEAARRGAGEAP